MATMYDHEKHPVRGAVGGSSDEYSGKHHADVSPVDEVLVDEDAKYGHTQRKLKSRHIQLIALGKKSSTPTAAFASHAA